MERLILASNSPRRKEILQNLHVKFDIIVSDVDEVFNEKDHPAKIVETLAYLKAEDVANRIDRDAIIIGADTIVVKNGIIGKPKNKQDARDILRTLSGDVHEVITGIVVLDTSSGYTVIDHVVTEVYMKKITDEEIERYIATGEPMDKAGAYGIQGRAAVFVEKIVGDYYNVVGLPICKLGEVLHKHFHINLL
ncbi:maf protein [Alkaliphilus metalliredigens QYMF]|uniref:dTTP/UTP pyrophosphatase n=1 Tax=Alkaliphilus metalliredigens (strain QYMF) TaxID=293826 RepID=NTPPA_ALKMQ|nr:Maf family protein [Alkaliphilus metalliredigens]A6TQH7.1 RecName: Full=dTTP/UTP pyrophosphatase; Short=dTTPase/UTPase; AltName: Full=Nucleoside triphosphate pyrophosphatase; AltName: Full=Nucleotide pyrophosphatase; Short=Nucleotide PPase [Alkaliphilus metalliredigens QYMF]ABR48445.1 maf protein [Alkaliphilus metalliredigens QYMF]